MAQAQHPALDDQRDRPGGRTARVGIADQAGAALVGAVEAGAGCGFALQGIDIRIVERAAAGQGGGKQNRPWRKDAHGRNLRQFRPGSEARIDRGEHPEALANIRIRQAAGDRGAHRCRGCRMRGRR